MLGLPLVKCGRIDDIYAQSFETRELLRLPVVSLWWFTGDEMAMPFWTALWEGCGC